MQKLLASLLLLVFLSACSTTTTNSDINPVNKKYVVKINLDEYYLGLQKRASQDDVTLDYAKLRLAFSQSSFYKPYLSDERESIEAAFILSSQNKYQECMDTAEQFLAKNYISMGAHYVTALCANALEQDEKAFLHEEILDGLFNSIKNSGDGQSTDTAYVSYSTEELYTFLQLSGLKVKTQGVVNAKNRVFDAMQVTSMNSPEELTIYFDITAQWKKGFFSNE